MPWVTPTNWVNTTIVTEAQLDNISDNLNTGVMRPLAEVILSGAAATVDFSNIPSTFRSLMLTLNARSDAAVTVTDVFARINNTVSAGTYHSQSIYATGGTPVASEVVGTIDGIWAGGVPGTSASAATMFGASQILALDYTNQSSMKLFRCINAVRWGGAGTMRIMHTGSTWDNGAALNRITLFLGSGNFAASSRFTLFAIPA